MFTKSAATFIWWACSFESLTPFEGPRPEHFSKFLSNKSICVSCHIIVATSYFAASTRLDFYSGLNVWLAGSDRFTPGTPHPRKGLKTWLFLKSQYFRNAFISGYFCPIFLNSANISSYWTTLVHSQSLLQYLEKFSLSSGPTLLTWFRTSDLKCYWQPRTLPSINCSQYMWRKAFQFVSPSSQMKKNLYPGSPLTCDRTLLKRAKKRLISTWFSDRNSMLARCRIWSIAGCTNHKPIVLKPCTCECVA